MRVVFFYTGTIAFTLGIFSRSFFDIGLSEIYFLLLLSFVLGLVWRRNSFAVSSPHILTLSVFLFLFALGILRFEIATFHGESNQFELQLGTETTLEGTIVREPDVRETTTHLYTRVDDELFLVMSDRFGVYRYGDYIKVVGFLQKPEAFETDLGRTFNYPSYLEARGVRYMISYAEIEILEHSRGNVVFAKLLQFKHSFMQKIEGLIPEPHVGLSEGLLLGVKRALGEDLEEVFRTTGIIHIVVLSGYNIMLVVAFVTILLHAFLPSRFQLPFGLAAISAFALLVGLSATVVRASIMAALYLIAKATNRTYLVVRALMLAGVTMLVINPYLLAFDTGFQLSFVATLGLILLASHLDQLFSFIPKILGREFLVATLATQIFVLPILLYQIGEFSVVSVIVNVLVLPMVPVAMMLTFLTGVVAFISTSLASVLAFFTYYSLEYILVIATHFAALPFASYVVPTFSFWIVILAYAGLAFIVWRLYVTDNHNHRSSTPVVAHQDDDDELSGWIIEDEEAVRKRIAAESRSDSAATDPPIFFR